MSRVKRRLYRFFSHVPVQPMEHSILRRTGLLILFFIVFTSLLMMDFVLDEVEFQVGQISDRDLVAPRTLSYVNPIKTKQLEEEVLSSVPGIYDLDETVFPKIQQQLQSSFQTVKQTKTDQTLPTDAEKVAKLQTLLPIPVSPQLIEQWLNLDDQEITVVEQQTTALLKKYIQRGLREEDLEMTRYYIETEVQENSPKNLNPVQKKAILALAKGLLKPSYVLNSYETEKRKQTALAGVEPVRDTIKKNQVIIRRGEVVSAEHLMILEQFGIYRGDGYGWKVLGISLYVALVLAVYSGYLYHFHPEIQSNFRQLLLLGLIIAVVLLVSKIAHYYSDFAAPIAAGALLTAILINRRLGLFTVIVLSLYFIVLSDKDLRSLSTVLMGSLTGVYCISHMTVNYSLTRTGFYVALVQAMVVVATGFIEESHDMHLIVQALQAFLGGILSAVMTIGLLPYLENAFGITTSVKLLELAKPNHPLLQRLLLDAPGTYHHSVIVGNMAETAAPCVGADPLIVRVGAYYHDIGKIKRPYFYVENQMGGENPHEKMAPSLSTLIITSHVKEGLELCQEYRLPQVVCDMVAQHHGTLMVSFFYQKAKEDAESEQILEADYRYAGPKPQTKEAALLMLADACEATVRTLAKPTVNRIESTVRKMIRYRLDDGQLDQCPLTLKDLNIIGDIFTQVLSGMFHNRLEYPSPPERSTENRDYSN